MEDDPRVNGRGTAVRTTETPTPPKPEMQYNELAVSAYHREQLQEQNGDTNNLALRTIDDILKGVIFTDERQRYSLLLGVEGETRTRTFTFLASNAIVLDPDEIPAENAQWVSVHPSTSIATLVKRFGDRLLFAVGHHKQASVSVLIWEVFSRESRAIRVLIRNPGN